MIPQLTEKDALSPVVLAFADALTRSAFTGDVEPIMAVVSVRQPTTQSIK